ncbi:hypothetical protein [Bacillus aerolatus]|nr:hypothetical protein [Bacillus aerolatus]
MLGFTVLKLIFGVGKLEKKNKELEKENKRLREKENEKMAEYFKEI